MKKSINLWQLSLVVWAALVYLAIVGDTSWYFYVALGFVFLERAFVELSVWITHRMAMSMLQNAMAALNQEYGKRDDNPPTGMVGGRPE